MLLSLMQFYRVLSCFVEKWVQIIIIISELNLVREYLRAITIGMEHF